MPPVRIAAAAAANAFPGGVVVGGSNSQGVLIGAGLRVHGGGGTTIVSISDAAGTTPRSLSANVYFVANADGGLKFSNLNSNTGLSIGNTSCGLSANGIAGLGIGSTGQATQIKPTTQSRATNTTVSVNDSFVVYDNRGAAGNVTFTLPLSSTTGCLGELLTFYAQSAQPITVAPNAADAIGTKAAGASWVSNGSVGCVFQILNIGSNTWAVLQNGGFS